MGYHSCILLLSIGCLTISSIRIKGEGHCHLSMAETIGCSILCNSSSFVLAFSDIGDSFTRLSVRYKRGKMQYLFRRGLLNLGAKVRKLNRTRRISFNIFLQISIFDVHILKYGAYTLHRKAYSTFFFTSM